MKKLKKTLSIFSFFSLTLFLVFISSCKEDEGPQPNQNDVELTNNAGLGSILVDSEGMTLYFFSKDADGNSACSGGCLDSWPVFYQENISTGTGLDEADFDVITRGDGSQQTTYKGWPLYYFSGDNDPGDTNGEAVNNIWFVAKPDYSLMIANQSVESGEDPVNYLVDAEGNTLYLFTNDRADISNCVDGCLQNWPAFDAEDLTIPSILNNADFGNIIRDDGNDQSTFKNWPLYYFAQDDSRGDINGQGVGDVWFVVQPDEIDDAPELSTGRIDLATDTELGTILTDEEGMTLYFFSNDADGNSACEGGCLDAWPVFYREQLEIDENLSMDDFGTITRSDGSMQTTYKGWPLYYFAQDQSAGDTNGEAVNNVWFVAKPDYTVMITNQAVSDGGDPMKYLVDAEGNTLYLFTQDRENVSNCEGSCVDNWPLFSSQEEIVAPSIIDAEDFMMIERDDGENQLTFKGWPLYYFANDDNRGETNGEEINNVWFVLNTNDLNLPINIELREDETLGNHLIDAEGLSLYYFSNDADGNSNCTDGCLDAWPIYYTDSVVTGDGLAIEDFEEIMHPNGEMQLTYKGWPLYYFASDQAQGDTNGEAVNEVWYLAKPNYSLMIANQALSEGGDRQKYLVDPEGNTLYRFTNDTDNTSNCTGGCLENWPAYLAADETVLPSILNDSDFGTINRPDDGEQNTYKNMPLYYFINDNERGDTNGEGVNSIWFVVTP